MQLSLNEKKRTLYFLKHSHQHLMALSLAMNGCKVVQIKFESAQLQDFRVAPDLHSHIPNKSPVRYAPIVEYRIACREFKVQTSWIVNTTRSWIPNRLCTTVISPHLRKMEETTFQTDLGIGLCMTIAIEVVWITLHHLRDNNQGSVIFLQTSIWTRNIDNGVCKLYWCVWGNFEIELSCYHAETHLASKYF